MKCVVCKEENEYIFCQKHVPKFGDNIRTSKLSIYVGTIPVLSVLTDKVVGLNVVKYWMGTDVLELFMFPPGKNKTKVMLHRAKMWLLAAFIHEHWFVSEKLCEELPTSYIAENTALKVYYHPSKIQKVFHDNFNILVYSPERTKFNTWIYGLDIIDRLAQEFPQFSWWYADGTWNMATVYGITDLYVRFTRHEGSPRMLKECEINEIPVLYYSDLKLNYKLARELFVEKLKKLKGDKMITNKERIEIANRFHEAFLDNYMKPYELKHFLYPALFIVVCYAIGMAICYS